MKLYICVFVLVVFMLGCQSVVKSTDEEIKADVVKLIRIETQIVDAAIEFQETADSTLLPMQDSLVVVLQTMSESLQKKYTEQAQLEKFQAFFQTEKKKK